MSDPNPEVRPFAFERVAVLDSLRLGRGQMMMQGLLEVDVTLARQRMASMDPPPSLTAWLAAVLARAIAAEPSVQARRDWLGRLVVFHDVDVTTLIEVPTSSGPFPLAHVLRGAESRAVDDLTAEIRAVQSEPRGELSRGRLRGLRFWAWLPAPLRMAMMRLWLSSPYRRKRMVGTVGLSSVGMFGVAGHGIPLPTLFPLQVTVGGIQTRPRWIDAAWVPRQILFLTLGFDHALVDGAPAARFTHDLVTRLERADLLEGLEG